MDKLVSIISPCYNGERYVSHFIESILAQTYDNIEFILVNDGSTDRTEEVVLSFKPRFDQRGFKFIYIYQDNAGQSEAINKGLLVFTGDYLTWPDSDDALPKNAIEKQVAFLEKNKSYGLVKGITEKVLDGTYERLYTMPCMKASKLHEFFFNLLKEFSPGGYMVRSSMFRKVMPSPLRIQTPRLIGQNYQMLLPVAYHFPCGFIDDICYEYTTRLDSHSHIRHTFEQKIKVNAVVDEVLHNIVKDFKTTDKERKRIDHVLIYRSLLFTLRAMQETHRKDILEETVKQLSEIGEFHGEAKKLARWVKYPVLRLIDGIMTKMMRFCMRKNF